MADEVEVVETELSDDDAAFAAFDAKLEPADVPVVEPAAEAKADAPADAEKPAERGADGKFKPRENARDRMLDATAKEAAAKRERDESKAEVLRLRSELAAARAPKAEPVTAKPKADDEPDPTDLTKYPEGQYDRQFYKDQARWEARQELQAERERERTEAAKAQTTRLITERTTAYQTAMAAVFEKDPQFLSTISQEVIALRPFFMLAPGETPTALNAVAEVIARSTIPDKFMVHFTKHPDDLQRLSTLPPDELYRDMGKLEARLDAAPASGPASAVPITQAKPVPKPLTSAPSSADDTSLDDDLPVEEFIRRGNRAEARARG